MSKELSLEFLQGQIVALTYAIRTVVDYQPEAQSVFAAIYEQLDSVSNSMMGQGSMAAADGIARIQAALAGGREMND